MWEPLELALSPSNGRGDRHSTKAPPTFLRHGIVTLSAPGMTTTKTAQSQPRSANKTVPLKRFEEVNRTGRLETASGTRSTKERQHGRNEQLITANQKTRE